MTELVVMRGLPGVGKTHFAKTWVTESVDRARINRDDFRSMMHDGIWIKGETERQVIIARDAAIEALLRRGISVINDDTNLPTRSIRDLRRIANKTESEFKVVDMTDAPLDLVLRQNHNRDDKRPVDDEVITDYYRRFIMNNTYPLPLPDDAPDPGFSRYTPNPALPKAVIVDIDGTVTIRGFRGPFEEDKIHLDFPNLPVVDVVQKLQSLGYKILFVSGRTDGCYDETKRWLERKVCAVNYLWMRPAGDYRKDSIVKNEIFEKHISSEFDVRFVLDDRDQVVKMWREKGLACFQVAEGNF